MEVYQMLIVFCNEIAVTWRKTQRTNLALTAHAVLRRKSLTLSHLAQQFPVPEQTKVADPNHSLWHRLKRLRRFLGNTRLQHEDVMRRCTHMGLVVSDEPGVRLSLLIDLTYFDPYAFLVISVPIAWHAFRRDLTGEAFLSHNQLIDALLSRVLAWLPDTIEAVIVGDREFARASLFRSLKALHRDFVIRVDQATWLPPEGCRLYWSPGSDAAATEWARAVVSTRLLQQRRTRTDQSARRLASRVSRALVSGHYPDCAGRSLCHLSPAHENRNSPNANDKKEGVARPARWGTRSGSPPRRRSQ